MRKIEVFVAGDGKRFDSATECESYDLKLAIHEEVKEYVAEAYPELTGRAATRHVNTILRWEDHRLRQVAHKLGGITNGEYHDEKKEAAA
jgi:hypothetical protein